MRSPRLRVAALVGLVAVPPAAAQQPRDTTAADSLSRTRLPELEVRVTRSESNARRLPFAVHTVEGESARRARLTVGIDEMLARIPGVMVLNRWNFSLDQRLSLRGAGSRANFGFRGVKILVDDVPQTLPDGQSQLTNLEPGIVGRVEALTGSAGALYGNASGGVLAFDTETPVHPVALRLRTIAGAFGTWKTHLVAGGNNGRLSGIVSSSWFRTDGFRQHSAAETRLFNGKTDFAISESSSVGLSLSFTDAPRAENPGALTIAEYAARHDSAAGNNILRVADKAVSQAQAALRWRWTPSPGSEVGVTAFGLHRDLENPLATPPPFGTGPTAGTWNAIDRRAGGVRITGTTPLGGPAAAVRLSAGVDLQAMRDDRRNERSVSGTPTGEVIADQRETVRELGGFAQAAWEASGSVLIQGALRGDRLSFRVRDNHLADGSDQSGERTFESLSGSLGASWTASRVAVLYANLSTSFESPTTTELVNQAGGTAGFNPDLGPQRTATIEAGVRGDLGSGTVQYSLSGFTGRVRDAIVQAREVSGRAFFANAGRLRVRGIEASLAASPARWLRLDGAYTLADHRFTEYRIPNGAVVDTLDGKRLPGVPRSFVRLSGTAMLGRMTLELEHSIAGYLYADDANAIRVRGWGAGVSGLRAGGHFSLGAVELAPFGAVENLFDRRYVGSVTINGVGGRVLEPAAGRQGYVGMEIRWANGRRG
jgi:iron complex outermembrane receptor protein